MSKLFKILVASTILAMGILSVTTVNATNHSDPYKRVLQKIEQGLDPSKGVVDGGVFTGVTQACFDYGQCSVCDILIVFISIANIIIRSFGIIALIFFIYGSAYLMLSQGNEGMITKGKGIIKASIIGTIIVAVSWTLVSYIVITLAGGSIFADGGSGGNISANPVSGWFDVKSSCIDKTTSGR